MGCASSHKKSSASEEYTNLVKITPRGQGAEKSTIYIDSANVIERSGNPALLVTGTFPDGCTSIGSARHDTQNDTLSITLNAWRNSDQMCTQALVIFSFIYREIPPDKLQKSHQININGTDFPLNR